MPEVHFLVKKQKAVVIVDQIRDDIGFWPRDVLIVADEDRGGEWSALAIEKMPFCGDNDQPIRMVHIVLLVQSTDLINIATEHCGVEMLNECPDSIRKQKVCRAFLAIVVVHLSRSNWKQGLIKAPNLSLRG